MPKPGVIPLRPLGVGEILDGAVSTLRTYWRTVLGVSLVVSVLSQVLVQFATWWLQHGAGDTLQQLQDTAAPDLHQLEQFYTQVVSVLGITEIIALLATLIASALLTMVVSRAVLGRPVSLADAWAEARPRLLKLLGLTLITPLILVIVLLVACVPGVIAAVAGAPMAATVALLVIPLLIAGLVCFWLWILFSLAAPALMLEKQGVFDSLRRSAKLVRGSWWRIFGVTLLAGIVVLIIGGLIQMPFNLVSALASGGSSGLLGSSATLSVGGLAISGVGAAIATTLTLPVSAAVPVLLYIDQRIRREALDIELARAAGLPEYGVSTGAGV